MFACKINRDAELRLLQQSHCWELFNLIESNRAHLRAWHPWVDGVRNAPDLERLIGRWLSQFASNRGFHAGIWNSNRLCGAINHLNIDWPNRSTVLSYWLDEAHQGKGLMTAACRAMVDHAFEELGLQRVSIECAADNRRSRAIPERLGFKLEGIVRGCEWLHNRFADHALYGMLKADHLRQSDRSITAISFTTPRMEPALTPA